jgi:hypothetical protein
LQENTSRTPAQQEDFLNDTWKQEEFKYKTALKYNREAFLDIVFAGLRHG